jgi:hypothetical protein
VWCTPTRYTTGGWHSPLVAPDGLGLGQLEPTRHPSLLNAVWVILLGNIAQECNICLAIAANRILRFVGVIEVLKLNIGTSLDALLPYRLAVRLHEAIGFSHQLVPTTKHHEDLEEDAVTSLAVHPQHVAALLDSVVEHDLWECLEHGVQTECLVSRGLLPLGCEVVVMIHNELEDFWVVFDRDREPNISTAISSIPRREVYSNGLTEIPLQIPAQWPCSEHYHGAERSSKQAQQRHIQQRLMYWQCP